MRAAIATDATTTRTGRITIIGTTQRERRGAAASAGGGEGVEGEPGRRVGGGGTSVGGVVMPNLLRGPCTVRWKGLGFDSRTPPAARVDPLASGSPHGWGVPGRHVDLLERGLDHVLGRASCRVGRPRASRIDPRAGSSVDRA